MALSHFLSVENKNAPLRDYSTDILYDENTLGHILRYVPQKKSTLLSIKWPKLKSTKEYWDGNPLAYISHLIGDEGKGSLMSELVRQGLAVNLMAGPMPRLQG